MTSTSGTHSHHTGPIRFELTADEADQLHHTVDHLTRDADPARHPGLGTLGPTAVRVLPERLVDALDAFRRHEPAGGFLIRGWQIDDAVIGPTPEHWDHQQEPSRTVREELYLALASSILGDIFAWSTVQDGRLIQDLLPIKGEELHKSAGSSASLLDLHNEDAFSRLRCDYLALLCLRNDDKIPTAYAALDTSRLTPEHRRTLTEPRYVLTPDTEHLRRAVERGETPPDPPKTGLLSGDPHDPYLAFDEYFIETDPDDDQARHALDALVRQLKDAQHDMALEPGDLLLIDNYRAVHGRKPFHARYDGRDRWLKRLSITRDLRKSRAARSSADSRVINTGMATLI